MVYNEYGVTKDEKIINFEDEIYNLISKGLNEHDLNPVELMILQRHISVAVANIFCEKILRKQFENKKKEKEI